MKIGVISDTHNFLDPQVPRLFEGVAHILHAGDIGLPRIILELERIAPVTAVLGNNDSGLPFQETEIVQLGPHTFLVHHIVNPHEPHVAVKRRIDQASPHLVVFGHTHKPFSGRVGQTQFFNPGYAGRPRFGQPRSVAILHCDAGIILPEFLELQEPN